MPDLAEKNLIQVVACPNPFTLDRMEFCEEARLSLQEILEQVQPKAHLRRRARIAVNGEPIDPDDWPFFFPAPGSYIDIRVVPKAPIAAIFIGIAAIAAQAGIAGAVAAPWGMLLGALAATVISVVGYLLLGAFVKPPSLQGPGQPATESTEDTPTRYLTGARNRAVPYGVVPRVYGRIRMTPPLAAMYYTELSNVTSANAIAYKWRHSSDYWAPTPKTQTNPDEYLARSQHFQTSSGERTGEEQWLRMLVTWGLGPLEVTDIKIADTDLYEFQGVEYDFRPGYHEDNRIGLYTNDYYEESLNIALTNAGGRQYRTTADDTDEFSIDIVFNGLYSIDKQYGGKNLVNVSFNIWYRKEGTTNDVWAGALSVTCAKMGAIRRGFRFILPEPGKYTIGVERTTADSDDENVVDESYWGALRSVKYEYPVKETGVALSAVRIKASDQLSGAVDELNGIAYSIIRDWDRYSQQWVRRKTKNPASHYLHILTDEDANPDAIPDARVDFTSLQEFHEFCEDNEFDCNIVFDSRISAQSALDLVAACGRAVRAMPSGKHGVVIDKPREIIAQHFTPRNSWDFSASQAFINEVHGFRCPFTDENNNWQETEVTVYADGYSENNATKFEELKLEGITKYEQVYKLARYYLAVAEYQREIVTFKSDFEYLTCERGSRIVFSHDVMLIGLKAGRLKEVHTNPVSTYVDWLYFDDPVTVEPGSSYSVQVRLYDGESLIIPVTNPATTSTITVDNLEITTPINPAIQTEPRVGDLFSFGESGLVTQELLVLGIEPHPDLTATLTCTIYDPVVYTAADGPIPKYTPKISVPVEWNTPTVAGIYSDGSVLYWAQGSWQSRILVTFSYPPIMPGYWGIEGQIRRYGEDEGSWQSVEAPLTEGEISFKDVEDGKTYEMRFRYIKTSGFRQGMPWTDSVTHTVLGKTAPPADVTGFHVYQDHGVVVLKWSEVNEHDLKEYILKYAGAGYANWDTAGYLTTAAKGTNRTDKSLPQGIYDFFIKAKDLSGNVSVNATVVRNVRILEYYMPTSQDYIGDYDNGTQFSISGSSFSLAESYATVTNMHFDYARNRYRPVSKNTANFIDSMYPLSYYCWNPATPMEIGMYSNQANFTTCRVWVSAEGGVPEVSWYKDYGAGVWNPTYYTKVWEVGGAETDWDEQQMGVYGTSEVGWYNWKTKMKLADPLDEDGEGCVYVQNYTQSADIPMEAINDIATIAVGGSYIHFYKYIGNFPRVTATISSGDGYSVKLSDITSEGFACTIYDEDGIDVGGSVHWKATTGLGIVAPGGYT